MNNFILIMYQSLLYSDILVILSEKYIKNHIYIYKQLWLFTFDYFFYILARCLMQCLFFLPCFFLPMVFSFCFQFVFFRQYLIIHQTQILIITDCLSIYISWLTENGKTRIDTFSYGHIFLYFFFCQFRYGTYFLIDLVLFCQ